MRPVRMKKWVRVGVLLLLVCLVSLGVVSLLYGRVDMLMAASSPHRSGARHARLQQALDGLTRIKGHKDNLYRLNKATSKTSKGITLAVVEEHHEVIPYWFKAAMMGKIPKTGNTLIHIDGHSDIGPPHYDPKMPFFHWPNTEEQMRHLMQANDVFIQAAMIAGLISRFIFISPSWDKSDNTTYARIDLDIGSLTLKNSKEQTFCCCMFVPSERKKQCAHYESALVNGNSNGASEWIDIISDRLDGCKMRRHCRGEQAVDHAALKMLKTKRDWIGGSGNIILDIDEDYFGVELPGESLADAGLKWDLVMQLQHSLSDMFCPKHITHEGLSNIMMREVIGTVIRRCQPSGTFVHDTCRTSVGRVQSVVHNVVIAYRKRHPQLFCTTQTKRLVIFSNTLTFILHQFKLSHLRLLMDLGVCLRTTPASLDFRVAGFGTICICLGANTPNSSVVFLHKPDAAEIRTRTTQLRKMLELIDAHHRPNIVTLCRSVRDGYTPRSLFSSIEANILGIFEDLPGHYDVVYDENLYGGKGGWPDRNKKIQVNSITKTRRGNRGV